MSHSYTGVNPISFGSAGAPGVVVTPQPSGYGAYSIPLVADGGDKRSAANLMAGIEANRDCINWLTWRTPDWISGGDYHTVFTGAMTLGNTITIVYSGPNAALTVSSSGGAGGSATAGGTNNYGWLGNGAGAGTGVAGQGGNNGGAGLGGQGGANSGAGVVGFGGSPNGIGVHGYGDGTGAGVKGTVTNSLGTSIPAVSANGGPVEVDTNFNDTMADPGANMLWGESFMKAVAQISLTGPGTITLIDGHGIASVAFSDMVGGHPSTITITLAHAMNGIDYWPIVPSVFWTGAAFFAVSLTRVSTTVFKLGGVNVTPQWDLYTGEIIVPVFGRHV